MPRFAASDQGLLLLHMCQKTGILSKMFKHQMERKIIHYKETSYGHQTRDSTKVKLKINKFKYCSKARNSQKKGKFQVGLTKSDQVNLLTVATLVTTTSTGDTRIHFNCIYMYIVSYTVAAKKYVYKLV